MIGQNKIKSKINNSLPKSLIIIGDAGCGKHTCINYISQVKGLPVRDVSLELSQDFIAEEYFNGIPEILVIDMILINQNKRVDRIQNLILKFLEEPPVAKWIIILCENKNQLLDTILNRCQIWTLEPYSVIDLRHFNSELSDEDLLMLATPNNIINKADSLLSQVSDIKKLCKTIIIAIGNANVSNTLSIDNKINFTDDTSKFDLCFFLQILANEAKDSFIQSGDLRYKILIQYINELMKDLKVLNINKKYIFDNFLLKVKLLLTND